MWKMIIGQSIYKLTVCFTLYFAGDRILSYDTNDPHKQQQLDTIIFNTFVWMQIFNELNCRRLDNHFNVFEGVHRNYLFMGINVLMVGGQVLIIFVGGAAFGVTPLDGVQWAICFGCSVFCIFWAAVLKLVPDKYCAVVIDAVGKVGGGVARLWRTLWCRVVAGVRKSLALFRRRGRQIDVENT